MLNVLLKNHHLILASGSPRRQRFFRELGVDFEVRLQPVEEVFPDYLTGSQISDYLAKLKAEPFKAELNPNDILITSDTIVWHKGKAINKPEDEEDAFKMIKSLMGSTHEVITSVCFTTTKSQLVFHDTSKVTFGNLTDAEIKFYITAYKPLDKAGAYGVQDWIGQVGVTRIEGSYFNVMGLPVHLVYKTLKAIAERN